MSLRPIVESTCCSLLSLLVPLVIFFGTSVHAESLSVLVNSAIKSDPRILSVQAVIRASQSDVDAAYASYYPVIRGNSSFGRFSNDDTLSRDGDKKIVGLELEQPIPIFGIERSLVRKAKASMAVEEAELELLQQQIAAEVLDAILLLRSRQAAAKLHRDLLINFERQIVSLKEALAGGISKRIELQQALARFAKARAQALAARSEISTARARLARLVGYNVSVEELTDADFIKVLNTVPTTLAKLLAQVKHLSPALVKAQRELNVEQAEFKLAKAKRWPKLTINLGVQRGSFGNESADNQSISLGLNVPIFEGGASNSRAQSAAYRLDAAKERVANEYKVQELRLSELWMEYQMAVSTYKAWLESQKLGNELIASIVEQKASGTSTVMVLNEARQDLLDTNLQILEQNYVLHSTRVKLAQESGLLQLFSSDNDYKKK
jgi:outer membrane protein